MVKSISSHNMPLIHSTAVVHPTAILYPGAIIGANTTIGPYSIIGARVVLGEGNKIFSHVVIEGDTSIGNNNEFFQFSSIGSTPQVINYKGGRSQLRIGNNNIFRESVTIQPGVEDHGGETIIGSHNHFMISSHIGHDCRIGNYNRVTNYCGISGHVIIGDYVIIGGMSGIQQFVNLGNYSFIGGGSMVTQDIPPYCMAKGNSASLIGINSVGLERNEFTKDQIQTLKKIFRELFFDDGNLGGKIDKVARERSDCELAKKLLSFIINSKRGIAKVSKHNLINE